MYFYNRLGRPITCLEWVRNIFSPKYRRVARTQLTGYLVSTAWFGFETGHRPKPLIFHTAVFSSGQDEHVETLAYGSESEAHAGHALLVTKYTGKTKH